MEKETNPELRCKAKFAGCRCNLRSGHSGQHEHDGAAGRFKWGIKARKRGEREWR